MKSSWFNKRRILLITASIVVIVALCAGLLFFALQKTSSPNNNEADEVVRSAEDAVAQLKELGDDLGYKNALSELTEKATTTVDGDTYYRLQQNYQGIPVYGRTVVCVTDENGKAIAITGNALDVGDNIQLEPSISYEQIKESVYSYFENTLGYTEITTMDIPFPDEDYLCIYNSEVDGVLCLAYNIDIVFINATEVGVLETIIDANSAEILFVNSKLKYDTEVTLNLQGQEQLYEDVRCAVEDGTYKLNDLQFGIGTCLAINKMTLFDLLTEFKAQHFDGAESVVWDQNSSPDAAAVDAYANTQISYQFFDKVLGNKSTDGKGEAVIAVLSGLIQKDGEDWTNNAYSSSSHSDDSKVTVLGFGIGEDNGVALSAYLDTVAHEYMHGVETFHSNMTYSGESGAIMEALSDIFGELVESWNKENNGLTQTSPDWIHNIGRNLYNPEKSGNPWAYKGKNWYSGSQDNGGVHINSTVISHAAYLMSEDGGGMLAMDELAKLWYRAMLMMPSDCDFAECRTLVELAATSMGLSDAQIACVKEAFDTVGINNGETVDYELSSSATLSVYGADANLYSNYTMQIAGTQTIGNQDADPTTDDIYNYYIYFRQNTTTEKYYETRHITTTEPVSLDLKYGAYTITLIDDEGSGTSVSFKIKVGARDWKDNLDIYTDFGKGSSTDSSLTVNSFAEVVEQCIEKCAYYSLSDEQQQVCRGLLHDLNDDGQEELILLFLCDSNMAYEVWSFVDGTVTCVASGVTESGLIYQNLGIGVGTYNENKHLVCMWEKIDQSNKFAELECIYKVTNGVYELSDTVNSYDLDNISAILVVMYPEYQGGMTLPNLLAHLQGENTQTETNAELVDAVYLNGHYYKVYNGHSSWEDAAAFCQSVGGHLATITSEEENTFLHDYLVSLGLSGAYFGFSDVNIEGNWVWCTGEEVTFTNWDSGEPNNEGRKEHYGLLDFSHNDGKWNDGSYRSGSNTNFICEWDTVAPPNTEDDGGAKTAYLLKQSVTYSVDYDNQPSKTKIFQYNQDGQLTGVSIVNVSKRTLYGETSYEEQLLEYCLECNESGCYSGFSASFDGSYSGMGTITCDANGRIVEFYSSGTGQKHSFSYNADGLICEYIYEYNGDVYTHSKMQYDSRGNIVSTERIQRDGSETEARTEIEYDVGDGLIMMTQYVNGVEQNSILQRCDTYGNVMKEEYYRDGTLTGWIEYTYEAQTVPGSWQKLPDLILTLLGG